MNTDDFTTAARAEAQLASLDRNGRIGGVGDLGAHMAEWARDHLAAQEPQVTLHREDGKPTTCEVRRGGVLIFAGRDYSSDIQVTQGPTDAEVEAARAAYWPAYSEAVRNAPSNRPGQGISSEDGRKAGLAGHRAALTAAKEARHGN